MWAHVEVLLDGCGSSLDLWWFDGVPWRLISSCTSYLNNKWLHGLVRCSWPRMGVASSALLFSSFYKHIEGEVSGETWKAFLVSFFSSFRESERERQRDREMVRELEITGGCRVGVHRQ